MRHRAELFLDRLDRLARALRRGQAQRVGAGEPADAAGQVDIVEQRLAAMPFQLHQRRRLPAPAAEHASEGGQQQVVDLGAVGRRRLLQQLPGTLRVEPQADTFRQRLAVVALRAVARPLDRLPTQPGLPPAQLLAQRFAAGVGLQASGPVAEGAGLGRQRRFGALGELTVRPVAGPPAAPARTPRPPPRWWIASSRRCSPAGPSTSTARSSGPCSRSRLRWALANSSAHSSKDCTGRARAVPVRAADDAAPATRRRPGGTPGAGHHAVRPGVAGDLRSRPRSMACRGCNSSDWFQCSRRASGRSKNQCWIGVSALSPCTGPLLGLAGLACRATAARLCTVWCWNRSRG